MDRAPPPPRTSRYSTVPDLATIPVHHSHIPNLIHIRVSEFAKLIQEMWTSNVHTVTPMELKRAFSTKHRMYSDYNQQDAQEFLRFFLDSLHSALNSGVKGETLNIDDNLR